MGLNTTVGSYPAGSLLDILKKTIKKQNIKEKDMVNHKTVITGVNNYVPPITVGRLSF